MNVIERISMSGNLEIKKCSECGVEKELNLDNYHGNSASKDGHRNKCRICYKTERSALYHSSKKITQLTQDNDNLRNTNEVLMDKLDAYTKKCEIAETKYRETENKYDLLVQDLKNAGKWPVKG